MIYNGREVEFPAIMQLSFFKVIEELEKQAQNSENGYAEYAKSLLKELERYPELRDGISDMEKLKEYQEPIRKLSGMLFPEILSTNEIKILTPPFYFEPLHTTRRFDSIIKSSGKPFSFTMKDTNEDIFYLYCCYFILGSYYGFPVVRSIPQLIDIINERDGFIHTYKMLINAELAEFTPTERAVEITKADYEELVNNFGDMELWKQKFPPNSWIMRGLNILNLVDITADQSISSITSNLLVKSNDSFEKIQWGIRRLLNNAQLSIGVLNLDQGKLVPMEKNEVSSLLLRHGDSLDCNSELCDYSYGKLVAKKEPLIITDVEKFHQAANHGLSKRLIESGHKSYMVIPIIHEQEFLGYMELGAPQSHALHKGTLVILGSVLPIIAMAQKRFATEAQNTIEAIIQQECTTIHPSVKWRFEEEAKQFMHKKFKGEQPVFKDIIFSNLYPLYGQMDIKGSSDRRNKAVSTDLIKQLNEVNKVLLAAYRQTQMQVFEELSYRVNAYKSELNEGLVAGSEHRIMNFLKSDVYPVFDHLEQSDPGLKSLINQYQAILDPELQTVYEERRQYDTNVNQINQRLASYLDEKQIEAQRIFPHYFERYKTDGIEFNIYIGQSITRDRKFNLIYLRNLRLWQLVVMCEMENELKVIKRELETSIEVASLILVYNTPISVHFRMDEKQFDVEGAYNARYEIIKKRVDKAHIKGTGERITQPGSIAIIYSQEQDAKEYRTYLDYLAGKGYLKEGYEDLELEDLQGVHGLRALRADVDYGPPITVKDLIEEMEARN